MKLLSSPSRLHKVAATVLTALVGAAALSSCGGSSPAAPSAPAAPAAAVDPSSDNAVTGPINKAREAADAQEAHDRALERAADGQP